MINYQKDNFEGSIEDIMKSVNNILNNTGDGFVTEESTEEESEMLKKRNLKNGKKEV